MPVSRIPTTVIGVAALAVLTGGIATAASGGATSSSSSRTATPVATPAVRVPSAGQLFVVPTDHAPDSARPSAPAAASADPRATTLTSRADVLAHIVAPGAGYRVATSTSATDEAQAAEQALGQGTDFVAAVPFTDGQQRDALVLVGHFSQSLPTGEFADFVSQGLTGLQAESPQTPNDHEGAGTFSTSNGSGSIGILARSDLFVVILVQDDTPATLLGALDAQSAALPNSPAAPPRT